MTKMTKSYTQDCPQDLNSLILSKNLPDWSEQVKIAEQVCRAFNSTRNYDTTELFSVAQEKIIQIAINYIPQLGSKYEPYLKSSIRGYLKNYIRDHSFEVRVPRRVSDMFMKTKKYASPLIASLHTRWSEEEIRNCWDEMKQFRSYNVNEVKPWTVEMEISDEESRVHEALEVFEEARADKELLMDVFIHKLEPKLLCEKHGKRWKTRSTRQAEKIRDLCERQEIFNT